MADATLEKQEEILALIGALPAAIWGADPTEAPFNIPLSIGAWLVEGSLADLYARYTEITTANPVVTIGSSVNAIKFTNNVFPVNPPVNCPLLIMDQSVVEYRTAIGTSYNSTTHVLTISPALPAALVNGDIIYLKAVHTQTGSLSGIGSTAVDHNTGGADALAYKDSVGAGIDNAWIKAYLKSDYDAGNLGDQFVKASVLTDSSGQWSTPMNLDPGIYTLYYIKQGAFGPDTVEITVG